MRILVPVFLLALAGCTLPTETGSSGASSRPTQAGAGPTGTIVLRRVMQITRDLDASLAFYRDALGLVVLERRDLSGPDLARGLGADATAKISSVVLGTANAKIDGVGELHGAVLTLLKVEDPKLGRMTHPRGGKGALGETVLSFRVPDLGAVEAKLRAAKANITGVGRSKDGVQQLTVTDPDGTRVLLYAVPQGAEDKPS